MKTYKGDKTKACSDKTSSQNKSDLKEGTSTTPPVEEKCTIGEDDFCRIHNIKASITYVSSKKWAHIKSTNSYGWRYRKVKKSICRYRLLVNKGDPIDQKTPTFTSFHGVGAGIKVVRQFCTTDGDGISASNGTKNNGLANGD